MLTAQAATEPPAPSELTQIAERVKKGENPQTSVLTLLQWFGAYRRGISVVASIRDALKALEIKTDPDFDDVWIGSDVRFVSEKVDAEPQQTPFVQQTTTTEGVAVSDGSGQSIDPTKALGGGAPGDPTYRIRKLEAANKKPVTVRHPPQSGWLDEWGRLKGGHLLSLGVCLGRIPQDAE